MKMTLLGIDLWNDGYHPSLGIGLALSEMMTTVMLALGRVQGTVNLADVAGWLAAGGGMVYAIAGMVRDM